MDISNFGNKISGDLLGKSVDAVKPFTGEDGQSPGSLFNNFGDILKQNIQQVSGLDNAASAAQEQFASGGNIPLHQVMLAGERADVGLNLLMQVRNKVVSAYQEIERMSI